MSTGTNLPFLWDKYYGTKCIPFFWDMALRHGAMSSRRVEAT
jgi:hypothetical protein